MTLKSLLISKLFTFLFAFLCFSANAQNVIRLENKANGNWYLLKAGDGLTFRNSWEDRVQRATITHITDTSLFAGDQEIFLTDISILGGTTQNRKVSGKFLKAIGTGVLIAGRTAVYVGIDLMAGEDTEAYLFLAGSSITALGGILWGTGFLYDIVVMPVSHGQKNLAEESGWTARITSSSKKYFDELYE